MNEGERQESACSFFPEGLLGIVFDVDGVLFDSRNSNIEYYNLIRTALHLPPLNRSEEDYCHMASVQEALERIVPPERREEADEIRSKINYHERILPMLVPEPGLLEALHWLRQWHVEMAICTNRTDSVEGLLHYFGLDSFFPIVKTAANSAPKPSPGGLISIVDEWGTTSRRVAFLGDSWVDQAAADAGGIPFWAFRNNSLSAQVHFPNFFELMTWLTPLVERP